MSPTPALRDPSDPRTYRPRLPPVTRPLSFRGMDRAFALVCWCVFALTFAKGFRFPGLWAATHFTFNYSQGFVKRALVGEVARRLFGDYVYRYDGFVAFSFLILIAVGASLFLGIRRVLRARASDWTFRAVLLVFCASPGTIFLVHIVGYFDFLGLVVVLGLLHWGLRSRSRFGIFYAITSAGLVLPFIHEGLAVMFGPTALFIAFCHWLRSYRHRSPTPREWVWCGLHALLSILLVLGMVLLISQVSTIRSTKGLQQFATRHADFALRPDAFTVLTQSAYRNITFVVPGFWRWPGSRAKAMHGQLAFMPGFLFVLAYGVRELRGAGGTRSVKFMLSLAFLSAALAPQAMNIVGWDWQRWDSMALMTSLICIVAYKLYFNDAPLARPSLGFVTFGVILTLVGLSSTMPLYDGFEVQFFPYERQFEFAKQVLEGGFRYRPTQ